MTEKELMLTQLRQAYSERSWHGTNLRGSIRGLTPEEAAWRPQPGRHNIWELIVHCAYWKYTVVRRITGAAKGSFALSGSNFFQRPEDPTTAALKADIALLKRYHEELMETVSKMSAADLNKVAKGSTVSNRDAVIGIAAHDLYHAGQIQLIKRMHEDVS
jgi:uncharacterized damage-inducible protein DinB